MASSSSSSGCCISSGRSSFQPRLFPDTFKLHTKPTHPGALIFKAAREGNIPIMKSLAELLRREGESVAVVEEIKESRTGRRLGPLHVAVLEGKLEMCEFLIDDLHLDVDAAAHHCSSPLICAIYGKAPKPTVKLLLNRGANPDKASREGFTVLHVLATKKVPKIADILLSRGANVDSMCEEGTPLHFAAQCGNVEMMKVLLKYKANPNRVVQSSYAPLTLALFASSLKCVELLIKAGADVNAARPVTPLIMAARDGLSGCIECLLEACADPNIPDEIGRMPVEIAAIHGRKECVVILFPVTSPVAKFADWSIDGIMQHVKSGSSEGHVDTSMQAAFKAQGDAAFEIKDYDEASTLYTKVNSSIRSVAA
ncbi:hypothetical protein ACQ4PT_016730 [Festuca glaucescens]